MICKLFFVILAVSAVVFADDLCDGKEDGIYGVGCRSYTHCVNQTGTIVDCTPLVFNIARLPEPGCDLQANTPPPCGTERNCNRLPDISYPNLDDDCYSFHTCLNGIDMGTQRCNPIGGDLLLVFSWLEQICTYPECALPPCGTRDPDSEPC